MALQKPVIVGAGSAAGSGPCPACKLSERFPTLVEFLWSDRWADGTARQTGTITLLVDQGMLKASLNDRDTGCGSFVAAKTFTSLLEAIEKGLAASSLEWRAKQAYAPATRAKKG